MPTSTNLHHDNFRSSSALWLRSAQSHTTVADTATPSPWGVTLDRQRARTTLAISKSRPKRNHLAGSAIPQAISRHILSRPQKRMAAKDKKVTTSGTENDRPSIEDLGEIFDEITRERLGRRDPITRRWQRKTWASPIWAIKSGHYNMQMLPHETTPTSNDRRRGPFGT
ncbi:uncharacterized protein FFUJ_14177 [Fusarium fujikuroi IMI 58289]|uniref:Uncharacterized protein n=1 Tax=Gibberella fujikuroi (strain CBS 195.34 / IMI 58289 / NRRL A-6831) TaxID=1279085 RepID=S0EQ31_GIBF5|nr:uncharacterized protein FFUJ_14177 [Fusarium fujikuroi IMI 58289]CCT76190.1 uncharacterized protein FFUJ_14177 [Fusarium fujikuroi IMI 58289]SCO26788.1 uncharacterized protein FFM5_15057 [Fusarium fujikuroi]